MVISLQKGPNSLQKGLKTFVKNQRYRPREGAPKTDTNNRDYLAFSFRGCQQT